MIFKTKVNNFNYQRIKSDDNIDKIKVINIISLAQENSVTDVVKQNLEKALEILRSTELYNPALIENDKHTSDLVSGLMSVCTLFYSSLVFIYITF